MATEIITRCDLCNGQIKEGERIIRLSAARWASDRTKAAQFDMSDFCSEGCALNAVRGLLNGAA